MKNRHCILLAAATCFVVAQTTPLFAAASFRGVTGSYAASNGHLGGGAETLSSWTIEMWIRPATISDTYGLFDIHGDWKQTSISVGGGTVGCLTMWPTTYYGGSSSAGVITANQWQLLGFVSDGVKLSIYRNGLLVTNFDVSPQIFIAGAIAGSVTGVFDFGLQDLQTLPDRYFYNGSLSDFRLWDRALTPAELSSHVVAQPAITAPGLLNWIPFNETSGTTFHDIVGGVTGTYYNVDFVTGPFGPKVDLIKAVKPSFSALSVGTNYQMQVSSDLKTWTNQGSPFAATNTTMVWPNYFDVDNWNSLFFRLQVSP